MPNAVFPTSESPAYQKPGSECSLPFREAIERQLGRRAELAARMGRPPKPKMTGVKGALCPLFWQTV